MTAATPSAQWSSRLGFILASAGSAIGLGAMWKFPYWAGENGGAAFIIPFILFTFTTGVVLVIAELALGRAGRGSVVEAMRRAGGRSFMWLGGLAVLTAFLILSYYAVVGGWCTAYLVEAATGQAVSADPEELKIHFGELVRSGGRNIAWLMVFLAAVCGTALCGVQRGIERLSKILMPGFFLLMVGLAASSLMLPGAWDGVEYLFKFSWEDVTPEVILNAMGFTFFSLSLGAGILVTYGAYVKKETPLPAASMWVGVLSVQAALLAGLVIMPAVFAYGLEPNAGPGLVFITLPLIFSQIPAGGLFAVLFYLCLLVAALTSAVSLLEVAVAFLVHEFGFSRRSAVLLYFAGLFILSCVSALSFGPWSGFRIFDRIIFDFLDYICTNFLMTLNGFAVAILMGWKAWPRMVNELSRPDEAGRTTSKTTLAAIGVGLKWLAPLMVLAACWEGVWGLLQSALAALF